MPDVPDKGETKILADLSSRFGPLTQNVIASSAKVRISSVVTLRASASPAGRIRIPDVMVAQSSSWEGGTKQRRSST